MGGQQGITGDLWAPLTIAQDEVRQDGEHGATYSIHQMQVILGEGEGGKIGDRLGFLVLGSNNVDHR